MFLTGYAEKKDYQGLVLVVPDGTGLPVLDLKEVNKLCTEELSISYEINKRVTAESANTTRAANLVGTNLSYVDVLDLKLTAGSFWSEESWMMASRYVVLNEPAAFQMFGSSSIIGNTVKFDGEVWLVTGVVNDGYKKKIMAYVPASAITGNPEALLAKTSGGTAAVLNHLSILDVYEGNCRAVDVEAVAGLFGQLFIAAVDLVIVLTAFIFICKKVSILKNDYGVLKLHYQIMYLDELAVKNRRKLGRMTLQGLQLIFSIMAVFFLARKILEMALGWKDIGSQIQYLTDYYFPVKMQWLMRYLVSGPVLFCSFVMALVMAAAFMAGRQR